MYIICNLKYDQISHAFAQLKSANCASNNLDYKRLDFDLFIREDCHGMTHSHAALHTVRVLITGYGHVMQS